MRGDTCQEKERNRKVAGLSIITPTRNPHYSFHQKVKCLAFNHPDWQIIVIDDHSDISVGLHLPALPNLEVHRNSISMGAGACRNIGIQQISKEYTLFMDDDDEIHWDVVQSLMVRMEADKDIDVSFGLYDLLLNGAQKSALASDCTILAESLQGEPERRISIQGHENLLAFTNYPWNKVYRSSFLQEVGVHFSETAVQNDVFAHWATLLRADHILLSDSVICTKVEYDAGERIGNTADTRCLQAFQSMRETYHLVCLEGTTRSKEVFLQFYINLVRWLASKCSLKIRTMIFNEHNSFVEYMRSDGFLGLSELKINQWKFWEVPIMSEETEERHLATATDSEVSEYSIVLTEISRLQRLAAEFRSENQQLSSDNRNQKSEIDTLRSELDDLRTQMNALTSDHDALTSDHHALTSDHHALRSENAALLAENSSLIDHNESLRKLSSRKIVRFAVRLGDFLHASIPKRHST